jgi:predicted polyphosphate/ATP-dependent NAD kinase
MVSRGIELLVIVGGDGTARDIQDAVGLQVPVVSVPAGEKGILQLMDRYQRTKIMVTPVGGDGFLFGRGNRQFTPPRVLRRVGREGIIASATSGKLLRLDGLRVDTGDYAPDLSLCGYIEVLVGENESIRMELRC